MKVVVGTIAVLYGAGVLLKAILRGLDGPAGSAYQDGEILGLVVAAAVLVLGVRYVLRGLEERKGTHSYMSKEMLESAETRGNSTPPPTA